jgi:hypothetical protein
MDELNSQARALLNAANAFDDPTDMDRERVRAAVLMRVGSVAAVGTATIAAAKASSAAASAGPLLASTLTSAALFGGAAAKVGAVVVIGALATAGAYVAFRPARHTTAVVSAAKPAVAPLAAPVAAIAPPSTVDSQPTAVDANDLPLDDAKPNTARMHARTADLEGEMKLLRQADGALRRGDSAGALAAVNKHAALYPSGVLSQEREGVRAIALCSAGSMSQGQAAARRFLAQAAKSPLSSRIRSACSIE